MANRLSASTGIIIEATLQGLMGHPHLSAAMEIDTESSKAEQEKALDRQYAAPTSP